MEEIIALDRIAHRSRLNDHSWSARLPTIDELVALVGTAHVESDELRDMLAKAQDTSKRAIAFELAMARMTAQSAHALLVVKKSDLKITMYNKLQDY